MRHRVVADAERAHESAQRAVPLVDDRDDAPHRLGQVVVGPGQLHRVPGIVEEILAGGPPRLEVSLDRKAGSRDAVTKSFESYDPDRDPAMRPTPFQAFVRTQTGLRVPLKDRFLAQAQLNYDWQGNPSPGREAVDQQLVFSIGYKW